MDGGARTSPAPESFDALRSLMANPGLAAAMQALGVTSAPDASYHTGGWAKQYG